MPLGDKYRLSFLDMSKEELLNQIIYCYTRMWGSEFNIFHWIALNNDEVDHSILIKSLLNRNGIHECGDSFLKLFLSQIISNGLEFHENQDQDKINNVKSFLEKFPTNQSSADKECQAYLPNESSQRTKKGRMDIYVEGEINGKKKAIIIENKLNADDQDAQLIRYDEWAQGNMEQGDYLIIYLSKDGHKAKKKSCVKDCGHPITYLRISYLETIIPWLNSCIKYIDEQGKEESLIRLRISIKQYREYLEKKVVREQILEKAIGLYRKENPQSSLKEILNDFHNHPGISNKIKKSDIIEKVPKKIEKLWDKIK